MDQNDNDMKRYSKMNLTMTNMLRPEILMTALDSFTCLETFALQLLFIPIHFYFPFFFVFLTRPLSLSLSLYLHFDMAVCVCYNQQSPLCNRPRPNRPYAHAPEMFGFLYFLF